MYKNSLQLLIVLMITVITCFAEKSNLPDPKKEHDYYSNKWLIITSTNADSNAVACTGGITLTTGSYEGLKEGLYVCVNSCFPTREEALKQSDILKRKGIENYIKHTGNYRSQKSTGDQIGTLNPAGEFLINNFIYFSRMKVIKRDIKSTQKISGVYFGLDESIQISLSDSIIDENKDTVSKGDLECSFFCPPQLRKTIKNTENLYCVIPVEQNRLLLIYFYKDWRVSPFNDSTYYVLLDCKVPSCTACTTYVQESASEIPGPVRIHSLGNGCNLIERISYRDICPGEMIQFTVFDRNFKHVQTDREMSTFPDKYLRGPRPVKRAYVPAEVIQSLNESMCYIVDSFYTSNYNGSQAIVRYDDFKLTDLLIWDGSKFVNRKE